MHAEQLKRGYWKATVNKIMEQLSWEGPPSSASPKPSPKFDWLQNEMPIWNLVIVYKAGFKPYLISLHTVKPTSRLDWAP